MCAFSPLDKCLDTGLARARHSGEAPNVLAGGFVACAMRHRAGCRFSWGATAAGVFSRPCRNASIFPRQPPQTFETSRSPGGRASSIQNPPGQKIAIPPDKKIEIPPAKRSMPPNKKLEIPPGKRFQIPPGTRFQIPSDKKYRNSLWQKNTKPPQPKTSLVLNAATVP